MHSRHTISWLETVPPQSLQVQLEADRISLINGADKAGRPCLVVTAANLIVADRSVDDCTRCICYALDCACEQVCGWAHKL